jgi:uncharacterized surface protein with fasciclin (FAS1) repeats
MASDLNIIDTAIQRGTFTAFSRLLEGSWLEKTLRSEASFTVFAPADIAFTRLSDVTLHWLLEPKNEPRLAEILCYHVVRGRLSCRQLEEMETVRTEQGQVLKIDLRQTILIDSARIILRDINATNGVIHGIDSLLMPCAVSAIAM